MNLYFVAKILVVLLSPENEDCTEWGLESVSCAKAVRTDKLIFS